MGLDVLAYLLEAGPWAAGREAEVTRRPRTRQPPSPKQRQRTLSTATRPLSSRPPLCSAPLPPSPLRATHRRSRPAAGVEPESQVGKAGRDLGPGLTWAAARTFWYKLFPWRGSGGPVKTAGRRQRGAELSWAMPTTPRGPASKPTPDTGGEPRPRPAPQEAPAQHQPPSPWGLPKAQMHHRSQA